MTLPDLTIPRTLAEGWKLYGELRREESAPSMAAMGRIDAAVLAGPALNVLVSVRDQVILEFLTTSRLFVVWDSARKFRLFDPDLGDVYDAGQDTAVVFHRVRGFQILNRQQAKRDEYLAAIRKLGELPLQPFDVLDEVPPPISLIQTAVETLTRFNRTVLASAGDPQSSRPFDDYVKAFAQQSPLHQP